VRCFRLAFIVVASLAAAPVAEAQIYTWRDASGTLFLSDRSPGEAAADLRTFSVPNATAAVRVTKAASGSYRDTYDELIVQHARAQGIRPDLVRAVVQVESGYNPGAISPKGAMGLMQLMPATASSLGVRKPFDPAESIRGGTIYLRRLLDRYNNNEELALAAYNAGPEAVGKYGNQVPPYQETRDYVRKVKGQTSVAAPVKRTIYYKTVEVVDGRTVIKYSDTKPASGPYEIVDPSKY
jgi:soluble lytic murein transglycosylase-like protein